MAYYKCPNCKGVFSINILVDPAPVSETAYPSMPCPQCGKLSKSISFVEYVIGKKIKET
jgi:phage FluMu protein Com